MLKIKDSVDLKELEKFRFEEKVNYYELYNRLDIDVITIYKLNGEIEVEGDSLAIETLYDLITSGLVEKVEEK